MSKTRLSSLFSPGGFVALAILLSTAYFACDGLGWRVYTSILSGTPAGDGATHPASVWRGCIYIGLYLGHVLASPILLLAAVLFALCQGKLFRTL